MEIKRPRHEAFDMQYTELFAFWMIIIREYSYSDVRSNSLLIYKNAPLVGSDGDA